MDDSGGRLQACNALFQRVYPIDESGRRCPVPMRKPFPGQARRTPLSKMLLDSSGFDTDSTWLVHAGRFVSAVGSYGNVACGARRR